MASRTEIANLALNMLGEPPVLDLSEDSKGPRTMSLLFDVCRDLTLRLHPWNFAVRRAVLAQLAAAPAFGFARAFALPADFLRLLRLNDGRDSYQIESEGLLADVSIAQVRYIARITDTARYDPLFVDCLAAVLAARAAMTITNSQSLEDLLLARSRERLQEARSVDGMEDAVETLPTDTFIEAWLGAEFEPHRGIS